MRAFPLCLYRTIQLNGHQTSQRCSHSDLLWFRLLNKLMKKQSSIQSSRNLFGGVSPKQDEDEALNKEYNRVMFDLYCEKRQTIILQMDNVMSQFKKLSRLVICERIPNLVLFNTLGLLFPNVTEIGVYANANRFRCNLLSMLNEISKDNCSGFEKIQVRCRHGEDVGLGSWICEDWNNKLEFQFAKKNWRAHLEVGRGADFDDVLTLARLQRRKNCRRIKSFEAGVSS